MQRCHVWPDMSPSSESRWLTSYAGYGFLFEDNCARSTHEDLLIWKDCFAVREVRYLFTSVWTQGLSMCLCDRVSLPATHLSMNNSIRRGSIAVVVTNSVHIVLGVPHIVLGT